MRLPCLILPFLALGLVAVEGDGARITVHPDQPKQTIRGIGFEIQSDSIGSGNHGLPEEPLGVPHDLVPSERERLAKEMLAGFRYCRLAGGLYWRGLDAEQKRLKPRWPEQLVELRDLLNTAKVEGLSFEYWSPAPFWKGTRSYLGGGPKNRLRCFAPDWDQDPDYHGDTDRFLKDFAGAVVSDIKTLQAAGMKVSMWGLQNEPNVGHGIYSTCYYPDPASYVRTYRTVAAAVRSHDPAIMLFADTDAGFPHRIAPGMSDAVVSPLVDAYAVHIVGSPCEIVRRVHARITKELPKRPWFQNEYEYLTGGATPDRCLNTVQHITNSFQLGENPTWFWIHVLKPFKNAEASGYSLGFWNSLLHPAKPSDERLRRWPEGPLFTDLPQELAGFEAVSAVRGKQDKPGVGYTFIVNQPVTVHLLVEQWGEPTLDTTWERTGKTVAWEGGRDAVYRRSFPAGSIAIPAHSGRQGDRHGVPHLAFIAAKDSATLKVQVGINVPIQIRSETLVRERTAASIKPGHWIFNPYNWNAVGSFVKHMPWDCVALGISEETYDANGRILAFKRPGGKMTVVVSNRSSTNDKSFAIATGLKDATWKGFRYTPDEAGEGTLGVAIGTQQGEGLRPTLPVRSWEFWEQQ